MAKVISRALQMLRGGQGRPADGSNGEKPDKDVERVQMLIKESDDKRNNAGPGSTSIAEIAKRNGARFLGDHTTRYGQGDIASNLNLEEGHKLPSDTATNTSNIKGQINRTTTALMATTSAMTESPTDVRFEEVETNDPWLYTLKPKAAGKLRLMLGMDPNMAQDLGAPFLQGFTEEELAGADFIDEARAEWMMDNIISPTTGQPMLTQEDFFVVNDKERAKAANTVFMNRWELAETDPFSSEHLLYSAIFGFQPGFFQWNFERHTWDIENVHALSVFPDPVKTSQMSRWDYVGMEHYIPLDKAVAMLPKFKALLEKAAEDGGLIPASELTTMPSNYKDHDYQRKMVQIRTLWEKHQEVPMTLDEAVLSGKIQTQEDGTMLLADGTTTEQEAKNWPTTLGIMQTRVLPQIGKKIDKMRCPYITEPLIWTVATPIMHCPWGLGEPFRLEDIQRAINRELTVLINWSRYYAYPVIYAPAKLYAELKAKGFSGHIRPGSWVPIPQEQYDKMALRRGRVSLTDEPPPLPRDRVGLLTILLQEHDRLSGHVEALQGRTPGAQTSGKLFEQLRAEARGPLGLRAKAFEQSMKRLAILAWDAMLKYMPKPLWYEILNQYPAHVVDELHRGMHPNRFNIKVMVSTTRGLSQQIAQDQSMALYQNNAIDRTTLLEDLHRDPDPINRRILDQQRQEAGLQVATEVASQPPEQPNDQGSSES